MEENNNLLNDILRKVEHSSDYILEPNAVKELPAYFVSDSCNPMKAIMDLTNNYRGYPLMFEMLQQEWLPFFQISEETANAEILVPTVKRYIQQEIKLRRLDEYFAKEMQKGNTTPIWLDSLILDEDWRGMVCDIARLYPQSPFVMFTVKRIVDLGFLSQVANLQATTGSYSTFIRVLGYHLSRLPGIESDAYRQEIKPFLALCFQNEMTFTLVQTVLRRLVDSSTNGSELKGAYLRILEELEQFAVENKMQQYINLMRDIQSRIIPKDDHRILMAINAITDAPDENFLETFNTSIYVLYQAYQPISKASPLISYLRNTYFLKILLQILYAKYHGQIYQIPPDVLPKCLYLLGLAACINEEGEGINDEDNIERVVQVLKELHEKLPKKPAPNAVEAALEAILNSLEIPMAAMAVLTWLRFLLVNTVFYETFFRTTEVSIPHLLLNEIAHKQPLQRSYVLEILADCYRVGGNSLPPTSQLALKRQLLDHMLFLVHLGYYRPVFQLILLNAPKSDESLTIYFVQKLLSSTGQPYELDFYLACVDVILVIYERFIRASGENRSLLREFIHCAPLELIDKNTGEVMKKIISAIDNYTVPASTNVTGGVL